MSILFIKIGFMMLVIIWVVSLFFAAKDFISKPEATTYYSYSSYNEECEEKHEPSRLDDFLSVMLFLSCLFVLVGAVLVFWGM